MKRLLAKALAALILPLPIHAQDTAVPGTVPFAESVLVSGLAGP